MRSLKEALERENITLAAMIPFDDVYITDRPKYERIFRDFGRPVSVLAVAVPYRFYTGASNISKYAIPRDYHIYFKELSKRLDMLGFADTSPFDERRIALDAGLGVIGKNGLLITDEYGSYVFIGVFFSKDEPDPELPAFHRKKKTCMGCGRCKKACPSHNSCLSYLTQKKRLTEEQMKLVSLAPLAWGCDVCQDVCPMNEGKKLSNIPFFCENLIPNLDEELLCQLERSGETKNRAWSWRGLDVIRRQINLKNKL